MTATIPPFVAPPYTPPAVPAMAGVPFDIAWRPIEARGAPFGEGYMDYGFAHVVPWGDGAVAAYRTGEEDGPQADPMLWRSADMVEWHRVMEPDRDTRISVHQLVAGGPGLVAFGNDVDGSILWVSRDGEHWDLTRNLPPIDTIWARPGLIVGIGAHTWLSSDGSAWWRSGPSPLSMSKMIGTPEVDLIVEDAESAIAFVEAWDFSSEDGTYATEVWRLASDGHWTQLADLGNVLVHGAVRGPDGVVVTGERETDPYASGFSADGTAWEFGAGPHGASTLVATPAGYVATSQRSYYQGCDGFAPAEQVAQTWTSHDGLTWRMMPEQVLLDHTVLWHTYLDGDRLVGLGLRWSGSWAGDEVPQFEPVAFEADLPRPEPSHTPLPTGGGCGGD